MATDTVELHYTGSAAIENDIIQVKVAGEWIDVMIGKESQLLSRIVPGTYLGATQPGERNTTAWAKNLCDMVDREALPVEKVIWPHGTTRDAPLEMSYESFRRSVRGQ